MGTFRQSPYIHAISSLEAALYAAECATQEESEAIERLLERGDIDITFLFSCYPWQSRLD